MQNRKSLIVYFKNPKVLKQINRYGNIVYYHKKRKYAVIYVTESDMEAVTNGLKKLRHVRKFEESMLDSEAYQIEFDVK